MWYIILGHIVGDYFLQSKKMALRKSVDIDACFFHCTVYLFSMIFCCAPLLNARSGAPLSAELLVAFFLWIFVTHFLIDRYSLGQCWLNLIKGRNLLKATDDYDRIFSAIVYVVVDNTIHILCVVGFLRMFTTVAL